MTEKLTPANARALPPGKLLRDEQVTGLELHAGTTKKSWKLYYRFAGAEHRPLLGYFPEMSLSAARDVAKGWKIRIARGENPSAARQALRAAPTVSDLCDRYLEEWAPRHKSPRSVREDGKRIRRHIRPRLGAKKVAEVTRADIDALLEAVIDRKLVTDKYVRNGSTRAPAQALQVRRLLSKLWNLARDDFDMDPRDKSPVVGAMPIRLERRHRLATKIELPRLMLALTKLEAERPRHAACIWTIFLTGARVNEIQLAKKHELQGNQIVLTKHKTSKHTGAKAIALPQAAMRLLETLPIDPESDRLFGDIRVRRAWDRLRTEAGCTDLQLRDARRTFLSYGLSLGETMDTLAKQAGHTRTAITSEYYAHLLEDAKDRVANRVANNMLDIGNGRRVPKRLKGRFRLRRR